MNAAPPGVTVVGSGSLLGRVWGDWVWDHYTWQAGDSDPTGGATPPAAQPTATGQALTADPQLPMVAPGAVAVATGSVTTADPVVTSTASPPPALIIATGGVVRADPATEALGIAGVAIIGAGGTTAPDPRCSARPISTGLPVVAIGATTAGTDFILGVTAPAAEVVAEGSTLAGDPPGLPSPLQWSLRLRNGIVYYNSANPPDAGLVVISVRGIDGGDFRSGIGKAWRGASVDGGDFDAGSRDGERFPQIVDGGQF